MAPTITSGRPFAPSSQRLLRLRAQSDLERYIDPSISKDLLTQATSRTNFGNRRSSVQKLPEASIHHDQHGIHVTKLLIDLDRYSQSGIAPLTTVASDDNLFLDSSPETLVEVLAQSLSWNDAAYIFDSSTYLIDKLQAIYSAGPNASCIWYKSDDCCKGLKDEIFLANLLYLLRRLQSFLFQILVHKCRRQVDGFVHYLCAYLELLAALDKSCRKEWPSGHRPLSTTWPWNIKPSLFVLWGVCWMFYPSQQGTRRNARTQPPRDANRFAFAEDWAESLPGLDTQQDIRASMAQASVAYPAHTQAQSETSRPGLVAQSQAWQTQPPMRERGLLAAFPSEYQVGLPGTRLDQQWLPDLSQSLDLYSARSGNSAVPTSTWPDFQGGNAAFSHVDQPYSTNTWATPYRTAPQAALQYQGGSRVVPSLEVSPITRAAFPTINISGAPPRQQHFDHRRISQDLFSSSMGETQFYPLSPRSDRQPSVATSVASASSVLMSPEHSSPASESSRRPRATIKRDRSPPRNAAGQIYCDHQDCINKNVTFKRPCEWNKHMDKHDRPYKCHEPGCEQNPGFTYSGGLLRHQREVHKMHMSARQPLYCPFPNCNRSSGTGFTRRENLEEHKRRRHLGESAESPGPVPTSSSPASTTNSMPPPLRKRRRTQDTGDVEAEDDDEDDDDDGSGSAETSASQRLIKRLRDDNRHKDDVIRLQSAELARLQRMVGAAPQQRVPATRG